MHQNALPEEDLMIMCIVGDVSVERLLVGLLHGFFQRFATYKLFQCITWDICKTEAGDFFYGKKAVVFWISNQHFVSCNHLIQDTVRQSKLRWLLPPSNLGCQSTGAHCNLTSLVAKTKAASVSQSFNGLCNTFLGPGIQGMARAE